MDGGARGAGGADTEMCTAHKWQGSWSQPEAWGDRRGTTREHGDQGIRHLRVYTNVSLAAGDAKQRPRAEKSGHHQHGTASWRYMQNRWDGRTECQSLCVKDGHHLENEPWKRNMYFSSHLYKVFYIYKVLTGFICQLCNFAALLQVSN